MKKIFIITNIHLIEVDEDFDWNSKDGQEFELKINNADITKDEIIIDDKHKAVWEGTSIELINPKKSNCGQCARCGAWVSDREKSNFIKELTIGATFNGELLCDEHLPTNHPLAF